MGTQWMRVKLKIKNIENHKPAKISHHPQNDPKTVATKRRQLCRLWRQLADQEFSTTGTAVPRVFSTKKRKMETWWKSTFGPQNHENEGFRPSIHGGNICWGLCGNIWMFPKIVGFPQIIHFNQFSIIFTIHFGGPPLFLETPKSIFNITEENSGSFRPRIKHDVLFFKLIVFFC